MKRSCFVVPPQPDKRPVGLRGVQHEQARARILEEKDKRGILPVGLDVTIWRNGPGRYLKHAPHLFDALGHMTRVELKSISDAQSKSKSEVSFANRLVELEEYERAEAYGGYGHRAPHGLWSTLRGRTYLNPANTSAVYHAGRLFALSEGGPPVRIDPRSLATLGTDDMEGVLKPRDTFAAHTRINPRDGMRYGFGISHPLRPWGLCGELKIYRWHHDGRLETVVTRPLPFPGVGHDFFITASGMAVVILPPMTLPRWPWDLARGAKSIGESLTWEPSLKTRILMVDLQRGKSVWTATDEMVPQHIANAWQDPRTLEVTVDVGDAQDPRFLETWFQIVQGRARYKRLPQMKRFRITLSGKVQLEHHRTAELEYPTIDPRVTGRPHRYLFGVEWDPDETMFGVPVRFDLTTGARMSAEKWVGEGEYAGEPLLVPKDPSGEAGEAGEGDVWLFTFVTNTKKDRTRVCVFDGADLEKEPVFEADLGDHALPYSIHGCIESNTSASLDTPGRSVGPAAATAKPAVRPGALECWLGALRDWLPGCR